jgi:uncharacterized membrane protein
MTLRPPLGGIVTSLFSFLYLLSLSLWVGGMAIFTFLVTPAVFRSYGRDQAGEIVGMLFRTYFPYLLVLSILALALFLVLADRASTDYRVSLVLLAAAIVVNSYVAFKLHPDAVRIKQQVASFEREAPDSPPRKAFRRLHALSSILNLAVLVDGVALLVFSRSIVGKG